jgi:hypothetical protein
MFTLAILHRTLLALVAAICVVAFSGQAAAADAYICDLRYVPDGGASSRGNDGYIDVYVAQDKTCTTSLAFTGTHFYVCSPGATDVNCASGSSYLHSKSSLLTLFNQFVTALANRLIVYSDTTRCNTVPGRTASTKCWGSTSFAYKQ